MIHNRIALYRAERGWSRKELAAMVEVNPQTIGFLERGDYSPSVELALKFARLFGVSVALVLVAWARLRGRPAPPVRFQWRQAWVRRGRFGARGGSGAGAFGRRRDADVVDVEFTEPRAADTPPPRRLE